MWYIGFGDDFKTLSLSKSKNLKYDSFIYEVELDSTRLIFQKKFLLIIIAHVN